MTSEYGENSMFGVNTIISLAYIKVTNPGIFSEPCQTSKKECFVKMMFFFLVKHYILDV